MERFGYINFQWLKIFFRNYGIRKIFISCMTNQNGKNKANNPTETLAKGFNTNSLQKKFKWTINIDKEAFHC